MVTNRSAIFVAFIVVAAAVISAACGGGGGGGGGGYPKDVENNFTDSCVSAGSTESACSCALQKIEDSYSITQFMAIEDSVRSGGTLPARMVSMVTGCESR